MKKLQHYVVHYRPAIPAATEDAKQDLFLRESGRRMSDNNISLGQRTIWKHAGQNIAGFPLKSNSRHLRASKTAAMHLSGCPDLVQAAPQVMNHHPSTSAAFYQTYSRGKCISKAKKKFFDLPVNQMTQESKHLKKTTAKGSELTKKIKEVNLLGNQMTLGSSQLGKTTVKGWKLTGCPIDY